MKIRSLAPLAAAALVAIAALAGNAQSRPARAPPGSIPEPGFIDGGTVRANGIIVPKSIQETRAPAQERVLSFLALGSPDVQEALGDFKPEVGAWCEYAQIDHGHTASKILVSVLPPVMPEGRYWLEIDVINELMPPMAVRVLAHGNPRGVESYERVIVQVGGQPPLEVPFAAMPKMAAKHVAASGAKITRTANVKLKVEAGAFDTERIHLVKAKEDVLVWRSDQVPLFGLVRTQSRGIVVELTASGHTGAHSLISAPIVDENLMPGASPAPEGDQGNGSDSTK